MIVMFNIISMSVFIDDEFDINILIIFMISTLASKI